MKKICHVTSAHPVEDGRIFRRACVSAAKAGYETYLVEQGETYDKNGVHIIGIGIPRYRNRLYRMLFFSRKAYYRALAIDADLYQIHDPELLPFAQKLKRLGKAVIFDSHENYEEQIKHKPYLPKGVATIISKWYAAYSRKTFRMLDGITYPGSDEYESVYFGLNQRIVATDNLPWLGEIYDFYCENEQRDPNAVCYIGSLSESRGITQIVKACSMAKCKLYLAGTFSSQQYKYSLERMEEYSCVEYLGVVERDGIIQLLQHVSVGLCTLLNVGQYYEMQNLPTKVYEYMSMALPVIMSDSPFNIRINNELHIGICVNPKDTVALGKTIRKLLDNPSLCKEFGDNGRKAIKSNFCWDREQDKLIKMYVDILGE